MSVIAMAGECTKSGKIVPILLGIMMVITILVSSGVIMEGGLITETNTTAVGPVVVAGENQTVSVGETVYFNGSESYDPDGYIASYNWDFGDGTKYYDNSVHVVAQTQITSALYDEMDPRWSSDGEKLALSVRNSADYHDVAVMNSDGSNQVKLTSTDTINERFPMFSPDGSKIVYVVGTLDQINGNYDVYLMNSNGSNPTTLTTYSGDDRYPVWSPDGLEIYFISNRGRSYEVWKMGTGGSNITQVTYNMSRVRSFAISPDGSKMLVSSDMTGTFELYIMNLPDATITQITNDSSANNLDGTWSPDGAHIVFTKSLIEQSDTNLWIIDSTGRNEHQLTFDSGRNDFPALSPDGSKIAYRSNKDGNFNIYMLYLSTGSYATHIFTEPGVYNVTLTVTDNDGLSDTDMCQITVLDNSSNNPRVDLSISDSDILFSGNTLTEGSPVNITATVHGDYDVWENTTTASVLFSDDFNYGTLSKWSLSSWNPSGVMEVTDRVSHSPSGYSAHAQSDPDTNTGPYIATGFNDTTNVLVEGWVYLPQKSQEYDKLNLLQVRHVSGGFTGTSEMSSNTVYYTGFQLSDDNYDVEIYEGVKVEGVWTRSSQLNVLSLEPERWYKLGIRIDENGFSMLVDNEVVYEGERLSNDVINTVVFGDTYGSSGGWGDAYLDDVTVTGYDSSSVHIHEAQNATCTVSFYLGNVSEQNLIYKQDNVFVPANGETTVSAPWSAVEGDHNIIVKVTDVNPSDSNMSNNMAVRGISVSSINTPPVADAGPDQAVYVGDTVYFDGSGSYDTDGSLASYEWDFGDGSIGTGINSTYSYATVGTYTVTLTVTDDGGLTASDTATVVVQSVATSANLTITKEKIEGPDVVETHTKSNWSLMIMVTNDGGSDAFAVTVHDVLPAELSLENYTVTQGTVMASQHGKGKMGSTAITWVVGTLNPGEVATFTMMIATTTNPAGHQEFTSPGNYSLNDGAWLTGVDSLTMSPIAAGPTSPIIITAIYLEGGNCSSSDATVGDKADSSAATIDSSSDTVMTGSGDVGIAGIGISINSLSGLLVTILVVLGSISLIAVLWLRKGMGGGNIGL